MIKSVTFKKDFLWKNSDKDKKVIFEKGLVIEFQVGINVLVGDQGAGKSTLLELIRSWLEDGKKSSGRMSSKILPKESKEIIDISMDSSEDDISVMAFDFESDGARSKGCFDWDGPIDTTMFTIYGNRMSHGQANKLAFNMLISSIEETIKEKGYKAVKPGILLLDEPDSALSVASIIDLHLNLRALEKLGFQIILSAHNPLLLGCFEKLYSVDSKGWIKHRSYMISQFMKGDRAFSGCFVHFYNSYEDMIKEMKEIQTKTETPPNPEAHHPDKTTLPASTNHQTSHEASPRPRRKSRGGKASADSQPATDAGAEEDHSTGQS